MKQIARILRCWLPLASAATLLCGLMYVTVQQSFRQSANDPQAQMAEDAASALAGGRTLDAVIPAQPVDISASRAPYLVIYDAKGNPLGGSGFLHGRLPSLPAGLAEYVRRQGKDIVTYQPEPAARGAAVFVSFDGAQSGIVMAVRSLRGAEDHIQRIGLLIAAGWLGTLLVTLLTVTASELFFTRLTRSRVVPL